MRAFLELIECKGGARCSLVLGERYRLPTRGTVQVGARAENDIVVTLPGGHRRFACAIRPRGTHHALVGADVDAAVLLNGIALDDRARDLRDGDEMVAAEGVRLRYVVERDADGFDTALAVVGPWIVFDDWADVWRCVPIDDPGAPPLRLLGVTGPDPLRRWRRHLAAGGGATAVRGTWDDGERRLVAIDDDSGASLDEIVAAALVQGGTLDAHFIAAVLRPSLHTIVSTRLEVIIEPCAWRVTVDGHVLFDGFVEAARAGLVPSVRSRAAVDELVAALVAVAATGGASFPPELLACAASADRGTGKVPDRTATTVLSRVWQWIDAQEPVSASMWQGLIAGLFPARVARERALRERLALLDTRTVARLPRR